MNTTYRSIWNDKTGTFVAVSEQARGAGKKTSSCKALAGAGEGFALKALALSLVLTFTASVHALPAGGVVSAGSASISSGAGNTTITQTTQNAAINWQSFSIGATEAVRFVQPNSNSVMLNRVMGSDPSSILGSLTANGKVFLMNPNGILFGQGAQVNVGGLVASTLNMTDADFMAGTYRLSGTGSGSIVNQGSINADGGYVALLGASVSNQGVISARLGSITLAAGNAMTLDVAGDGLLNVTVNQGAVNALVENGGLIRADGGQVWLTAKSAGDLLQSAVNNTGVIQAQTIVNQSGTIMLMGDMQSGTVNVGGTLDASAPNGGNGGFIETSAAHVNIASNARVTTVAPMGRTGTWLIDPQDFTIGSAPGDNITGATLSNLLITNSVIISTNIGTDGSVAGTPPVSSRFSTTPGNGDINVNEAVSWTATPSPTTLTLNAARDVNINRAITATNGNLVVCCGRDVNVNAAVTTTNGSILMSAGNNVNIVRTIVSVPQNDSTLTAMTTTDGNMTICAANDINISAPLALTRGSSIPAQSLGLALGLVLNADSDGTGPGVSGGTVNFGATTPPVTVTGPNAPATIYYNPTSYATPTDYSTKFTLTLGATLNQRMLVFAGGADKFYDGTTSATFLSLKGAPAGVSLVAGSGSTAAYDTADVGTNKSISFSGYTLAGVNASQYALAVTCCSPIVNKTTGNINPVVVLAPVPPLESLPFGTFTADNLPVETMPLPIRPRFVEPTWAPLVSVTNTPSELLSLAPPVTPVVAPAVTPEVVPVQPRNVLPVQEEPKAYVAPVRPRKQDRN
jgi:filamentous hemagglutinin family protein